LIAHVRLLGGGETERGHLHAGLDVAFEVRTELFEFAPGA
jgi:hypothetical protein